MRQNIYTAKTPEIASPTASVSVDANEPPEQDAARADATKLAAEEQAYIRKLQVNDVHAGGPVVENAVFGEIKNTGNHRLLNVALHRYHRSAACRCLPAGRWRRELIPRRGCHGITYLRCKASVRCQ